MRITLYEYQLDKNSLIVLDENCNILYANNESLKFFSKNETQDSKKLIEKLEKLLSIDNLNLFLKLTSKKNLEFSLDILDNKRIFFKSYFCNSKKRINIIIIDKNSKSLESIINNYSNNSLDALIYFDQLTNELKVTKEFFDLFDINYNNKLTSKIFFLKVLRKLENKISVFNLISNNFNKYDEFLGFLLQTSGQKIEYVYKKYQFGEDLKGILFNFVSVDREIPKVTTDHTTQLIEKNILLEEIKFLINSSKNNDKNLALLIVNIDNFKNINELYGFKMGDYTLKNIAKRLKKLINSKDILVRYSADEFIIFIDNYDTNEDLEKIALRILKKVSFPIKLLNKTIYVKGSVGVAIFEDDTLKSLLKKGMSALSFAKNSDTKISFYNRYTDNSIKKKLEFEEELKDAIKHKDFIIYYQPQISYLTKNICGIEALVRWKHKKRGIINPGMFIKIAEELDLIKDIEEIVLEKSIKETKKIRNNFDLSVAVNLSNKQFIDDVFIKKIKESNENMNFLEIEITESAAVTDSIRSLELINSYKELGISIAIDDFGIGYSSLSHLKNLPIDKIKIDKSFVDNIVNSKGDQTLIQAVLLIAETLKVSVIVEGVENKCQLNKLIELGCNLFQGFYFQKPCDITELEKNLFKNRYQIRG